MANRVLHQRLDTHGRLGDRGSVSLHGSFNDQAVAEVGLLYTQIPGDEFHLLFDPDPSLRTPQRIAKDLSEILHRLMGELGLRRNKSGDSPEGVKEKVRVDLSAERPEFCTAGKQASVCHILIRGYWV